MEGNGAESIRAARRKARILNNPEARINRILGNSTDSDKNIVNDSNTNKVTISNSISQNQSSIKLRDNSPLVMNKTTEVPLAINKTLVKEQLSSEVDTSCNQSIIKDASSNALIQDGNDNETNDRGITTLVWIMLGIVTRAVLGTELSWIIGNSALAPFLLSYITLYFVQLNRASNSADSNSASSFTLVEIALRLCGLPAHIIKNLMSIKRISEAFLKTFSLFFIPFVMSHILISVTNFSPSNEESTV